MSGGGVTDPDLQAELNAIFAGTLLHNMAPEVLDEASGQYVSAVNEDGSLKCADDCRGCAALARVASRLERAEQLEAIAGLAADVCDRDTTVWGHERREKARRLLRRALAKLAAEPVTAGAVSSSAEGERQLPESAALSFPESPQGAQDQGGTGLRPSVPTSPEREAEA